MLRGLFVFAAVSALCLPPYAMAAPPPPLSTDVYGRLPNVSDAALSPSGEQYAYINDTHGQQQLLVKDLAGQLKLVAPLQDNKILYLGWAGEDHVLVRVGLTGSLYTSRLEYNQVLSLNVRTKKSFLIFDNCSSVFHDVFRLYGAFNQGGHWYGYFGGITMQKSRGFDPTFNSDSTVDLYKVDLDDGGCTLVAPARDHPHEWALDASGAVVAHAEYYHEAARWTLRPGVEGGDVLAEMRESLGEVSLEGVGRTPGSVLVAKAVPEEWSLADGSHKPLEVGGLINGYIHDPTTRRLLGVWLAGEQPRQSFFEPALKTRQAAFAKALGGDPKIRSWSSDFKRLILLTEGNGDAGTYWLVDGPSVKPFAYRYPEIPDASVGPVRPVVYKAADGLEIHGVLTLPPGREPKNLPVVVLPHGGPQAHDVVGFDWLAQAFAGRGYAVLQPNFRGSDGYGLEFRNAGFGEWGRKMQTDISDGLAELGRQGVIDPKRACIVGASYGGYAALAGVTLQHGLYRCAVAYAGVADVSVLFNNKAEDQGASAGSRYIQKFLGAERLNDPVLRQISPSAFADKADAPILLIHGDADTVVPISQTREMERKLRAAGKPVEFVQLKSADHPLLHEVTRQQMLAAAVAFVEKHNPPD